MSEINTAPVDMFTTLRSPFFGGRVLSDVKAVQASILRYGLLSPIIVTRSHGKLVVVDGRKRLAAIRRLDFMGRLPRSLVNIPYIEVEKAQPSVSPTPPLMSNRDLYRTIVGRFAETRDLDALARDLYLTRNCVKQVLTLTHLSPRLRRAFFDQIIDFAQAKAYAATPLHNLQERAFMSLGPFAGSDDIIDYLNNRSVTPTFETDYEARIAA